MSFKSTLSTLFKKVKTVLQKAWELLEKAGLNDEVLEFTLKYVRAAETKFLDNTERREWVVKVLVDHKIPEGVARMAVELAVRLLKKELDKAGV